jgi:DNA-directed RNA polymerase subunit RPC12/RpoP
MTGYYYKGVMKLKIAKLICEKCGQERIIRTENPVRCSRCGHKPGVQMRIRKVGAFGFAGKNAPTSDKPTLMGGIAIGQ